MNGWLVGILFVWYYVLLLNSLCLCVLPGILLLSLLLSLVFAWLLLWIIWSFVDIGGWFGVMLLVALVLCAFDDCFFQVTCWTI